MAVIGFDPVITVTARPLTTWPSHMALVLKLVNRRRIAPQTVSGEYAWRLVVRVGQRVLQEHFGCGSVSCFREVEVDGLSMSINGAEQAHPATRDAYERLVHVPRRRLPLSLALQALVDLWAVGCC